MNGMTCWMVVVVALVLAGCGVGDDAPRAEVGARRGAITGGMLETGYPAVFSLAMDGAGECTGTCITPRVATTAAHCIAGADPSSLTALFGDDELAPTTTLQVTATATEPGGGDIALLAFDGDCPATIPVNRTALEAHVGEPVVMVGFGSSAEMADDAGIKRSGTATLFSVDPTAVSGMDAGELATSNNPAGTCYGDSGGPTFMTFGGTQYMVGVTARGSLDPMGNEYPCAMGRSIAVRADSYLPFIDMFVAAHGASVDAGTGGGDAGAAGHDAGAVQDAAVAPGNDAGMAASTGGGGCGCRVAGGAGDRSGAGAAWIAFGLLGLLAARRNRRGAAARRG